jgi:hypothetical protein
VRLLFEAGQPETRWLDLTESTTRISLPAPKQVKAVELDPDYRIWRRVEPRYFPPILREIFIAPRVGLLLTEGDTVFAQAAAELADHLLDVRPQPVQAASLELPGSEPLLIIGQTAQVAALLVKLGLPPAPPQLAGAGSAQVWTARDEKGRPYAVIAARDSAALSALQRPLPHYGRQSWLLFDAARALDKGVWPPQPERIEVEMRSH